MKRFFKSLAVVVLAVAVAACSRHKIIPDDTLAQIFHDAFLTNAYIEKEGIQTDTLNFYEPIFEKYGYSIEDVRFTIGNFSKRKSARLGDVVEVAIDMLEERGKFYEKEVAVLDTIDNTAQRLFTRAIYTDSLIRIKSIKDSTNRIITLDNLRQGEYKLLFDYKVDSLDNYPQHKMVVWFERSDSTQIGRQQFFLRKSSESEEFSRALIAGDGAVRLVVDLLSPYKDNSQPKEKKKKQHIGLTITDLRIVHIPIVQEAVDSLYAKQLDIKIFADEFLSLFDAQDSLASGAVALRDSI
ncbi:MAG: DUF4296 domain-containing protein [Alistipes sp.]|nr:DUF4296 domain-containing protein [Alistipes sp.]